MSSLGDVESRPSRENLFSGADVFGILREHEWLSTDPASEHLAFCERAAALLGPQANDGVELAGLLELVFLYNAGQILQTVEAHAVLSRYGARDVVRELVLFLLDPTPFNSGRFKEVIALMKENLDLRGRDLFHPVRLVLTGRVGDGELDRVILLLDEAAAIRFSAPVKSTRVRALEFCSVLD
jgi:nondiscriminating glutamyl-tRNA synthetase